MALSKSTPVIGPFTAKMTRIQQMWSVGCTIDPQIWALGWFSALPQLFWSLYGPDCRDQAYDRLKRRHKAKRTGIMNVAAQSAPGIRPKPGALEWVLFHGAEFAQRAGWYLLLADALPEQIIIATSLAYKYQGCLDPTSPYALLTMTDTVPALPGAHTEPISSWVLAGSRTFIAGPQTVACPRGYDPGIGLTFNVIKNPINGDMPAYRLSIEDVATGLQSPFFSPTAGPSGSNYVQQFIPEWGFFGPAHNFQIILEKAAGFLYVSSATWTVYGGPKIGLGSQFCSNSALKPINP